MKTLRKRLRMRKEEGWWEGEKEEGKVRRMD